MSKVCPSRATVFFPFQAKVLPYLLDRLSERFSRVVLMLDAPPVLVARLLGRGFKQAKHYRAAKSANYMDFSNTI